MHYNQRIHFTTRITNENISLLMTDEITALVIKNFYPAKDAARIAEKIISSENLAHYTHEIICDNELRQEYLGVDREGVPFNLLYDNDHHAAVQHYYQSAKENIERIRSYAAPAFTPIDKLRLELDENYSHGAMIAAFRQRKMLAGIGRVSHAEMSHMSEDPPHFDALPAKFAPLARQFAANIYLKVPEHGGELEIWDVPPLSPLSTVPEQWRQQLPASTILKAEIGDLIIFNCRRPHAIRRFSGEPRVTMQVFIGYEPEKALQLWN